MNRVRVDDRARSSMQVGRHEERMALTQLQLDAVGVDAGFDDGAVLIFETQSIANLKLELGREKKKKPRP